MKNRIIRITAICLSMLLSFVCVTYAAEDKKEISENSALEEKTENTEKTEEQQEDYKNETVYVLTESNGTVKKVIVSDWIKNNLKSEKIEDISELQNIENVKGDEALTMSGENSLVWDADGNDIFYRGNISKDLPVSLSVNYLLDGKEISPNEIKGKSGEVTVRFSYTNNRLQTVKIKGKDTKIYVPFAMVTGLILDNEDFKDIKVTNGKLINDGKRTYVCGIAFPGLSENLGLDSYDLQIPSSFEITANAKDFRMGMTVTLASNDIFNGIDTSKLNTVEDFKKDISTLTEGMNSLVNGSSSLYTGLQTLLDKSDDLVKGIEALATGAKSIKDGAEKLDAGAENLKNGATELSVGLGELQKNNETLKGGAKQIFDTLLSTAENQIKSSGITIPKLTVENYSKVLDDTINYLGKLGQNGAKGVAVLTGLKKQLDSYNEFYKGLSSYTDGVSKASDGSKVLKSGTETLKAGTEELKKGTKTLYDGIFTLKNGLPALTDGVKTIKDGSMQLSGGLKQLDEKGISKIAELYNKDISEIIERIKATVNVSKNYNTFSGKSENFDGSVKFIYRTDEIK